MTGALASDRWAEKLRILGFAISVHTAQRPMTLPNERNQ